MTTVMHNGQQLSYFTSHTKIWVTPYQIFVHKKRGENWFSNNLKLSKFHWSKSRAQLFYQNSVKMQPKLSQNAVKIQSKCNQSLQLKGSQNTAKKQSKCSQNVVKYSQNAVKMQS